MVPTSRAARNAFRLTSIEGESRAGRIDPICEGILIVIPLN